MMEYLTSVSDGRAIIKSDLGEGTKRGNLCTHLLNEKENYTHTPTHTHGAQAILYFGKIFFTWSMVYICWRVVDNKSYKAAFIDRREGFGLLIFTEELVEKQNLKQAFDVAGKSLLGMPTSSCSSACFEPKAPP